VLVNSHAQRNTAPAETFPLPQRRTVSVAGAVYVELVYTHQNARHGWHGQITNWLSSKEQSVPRTACCMRFDVL
jgi:hypothetical protein